jgi:hypothetical protein
MQLSDCRPPAARFSFRVVPALWQCAHAPEPERPGRAAWRNERARASVRLARSVLVRCGRLFLGPRRARSPGESSSPSLPAPRNPQCPVAWIRAVSASLLRFHRRGSDTGSDPRQPTPVPRPERACAEGCLRHLLVARSGNQPGSASRGAVGRQRRTAGSASSAWRPGCCVDVPGIARRSLRRVRCVVPGRARFPARRGEGVRRRRCVPGPSGRAVGRCGPRARR